MPTECGFYWLHRDGQQPAVGRFEHGVWAIIGVAEGIDPEKLVEADYRVGLRVGPLGRR